ncbi:MAG: tetratricopeptide repeat protein [Rikenellaceae bacterium]
MKSRREIGRLWRSVALMVAILTMSVATLFAQYNKDYFLWMGRRYMIANDYQAAITTVNTLLRSDSYAYEAYFLRAIAKYNLGDLMGADSDFSLAIEYNPVYTMAYTYRAITRSRMGNYDDALQDFANAIDLRPDLSDAYYSRGVTRLLNKQYDEAVADFDQYITKEPKVADAYINRAITKLFLKDTSAAYKDLDRAIKNNTKSPEGYSRRGTLYLQQSKYAKAEADLNSALEIDSTHITSLFNRAIVRNNILQPEKALEDFDRILDIDPTSSITYFNRAIILSQIGDYNNSLGDLNHVAELSPNNVLVYFYRANILYKLGEVERAEIDYTRAIELYPDFANAYLNRANVRILMGHTQAALADRKTAERKIAEHESKLHDDTYSIYSDSTYKFDKLLSFDTKLTSSTINNNVAFGGATNDLQLIPLYKFTLVERDSTKFDHKIYYDAPLEEFIASIGNPRLSLECVESNISADSLSLLAREISEASNYGRSWIESFELGVAQNLIRQYTSSLEHLGAAANAAPSSAYVYLNRAVTHVEMVDFISSIERSFQRITIETNPANKLKNTERNYDYNSAIADIERAIELHPTLAYSHYNYGGILAASGMLPEAYDAYTKAIELYSEFAEAYYNRAVVQIMMRDIQKGCIDLSKAGELGIQHAYDMLDRYSDIN